MLLGYYSVFQCVWQKGLGLGRMAGRMGRMCRMAQSKSQTVRNSQNLYGQKAGRMLAVLRFFLYHRNLIGTTVS